jgi:hypothetical protein
MAKRSIWAGDEDNKPKKRETYSDDTVGRFASGTQEWDEKSKKMIPVALSEWKVSTGEKTVADAVAQLFGGTPVENEESPSEHFIDVLTTSAKVPVIIEQGGVDWDMKLWWNKKLKHHCDGFDFLSHNDEEMIGQPCGCPTLFGDRKAAANEGDAPNPNQWVLFRLADDPELGTFRFNTGSWTLFKVIHEAQDDVERIGQGGPVLANLELELVEYTAKKGKMRGQLVSYMKPAINVVKAYDGDDAE